MAIIRDIPEYVAPYEVMMNLYPDQFLEEDFLKTENGKTFKTGDDNHYPMPKQEVASKTKQSAGWWKINMDYFYTVGLAQYNYQREHIVGNYELLKGKITAKDFYAEKETPQFDLMDKLIEEADLPSYVVHYPILNPPINTMVGEMSKRPDVSRPKAMDDNSQSEELQYYTDLYIQLVTQGAMQQIAQKLQSQGVDVSSKDGQQQVQQMTEEKIKEYKVSYTTEAEIWASNIINVLKVEFNLKEKFEKGFRDMLIVNKQFYHIYEDKSKTGFRVDKLNPKYVWWLTTPDKEYTRDAYAAGIVEIMELSEIINKYDLTLEEIDHLRRYAMMAFFPYSKESQVFKPGYGGDGIDSIDYNTYDPAILRERNKLEAMYNSEATQTEDGFLGNAAPNVGTFGNRFVVTTAYWLSKRKVGLLTYVDKDGTIQSDLVDDNYHDGDHPQEITIEWDWKNQWYKGLKIGDDIYYVEPLECLDYCPIIGVSHEILNTHGCVSLLDLMKSLQTIYNVCWNQIFHLLETEPGKVLLMNKRFLPLLKGSDYADSESIFMRRVQEEHIVWIDDSPDNLKGQSGFNQFSVQDWSFSDMIDQRLRLAIAAKDECWELIGMSKQRQGSISASETATATNTALTQSYAQTEPYFVQHEYLINQVLQAILDVAQYVECKKPESTLSYINSEGANVFLKIQTATGLKGRDIKLFITSRAEDQRILQKLQDLSQPMLQNGVSAYEVSKMYTTNSTRQLMDLLKKQKDMVDQANQQKQQMEQQQQQMQQQQIQAKEQQDEKARQEDNQIKIYEVDTKANTELTIARMKIAEANLNKDTGIDLMEIAKYNMSQQQMIHNRDLAGLKLALEKEKEKNDVTREQRELSQKDRKMDLEEMNIRTKENLEKQKIKEQKQKPKSTK